VTRILHDLSPAISPALAVFPGDTPPSREVLLDMRRGDSLTLSTWRSTVHVGAHVDAPSHYGRDGRAIDQQPLDLYIGPCQVMRVDVARGRRVAREHLTGAIRAPRLLLATGTFPDPANWNTDFAAIEPALVDHLHGQGVRLVGIDTPSVDPATAKSLDAHHRFLAHDMAILEGIVLTCVPDGLYELISLPLRLAEFDASPVRAILREATGTNVSP
jgi:arylformamidase